MKRFFALVAAVSLFVFSACDSNETFTTDRGALLQCETDTASFDTVFAGLQTATQKYLIYNRNKESIRLSSVSLASGGTSGFRFNIDGQSGPTVSNVEIAGGDSLFLLIDLLAPQNDAVLYRPVSDELRLKLESGVEQRIVLSASALSADVVKGKTITSDTTFTSDRPIIVYDSLVVAPGACLTLSEGTSLYFHSGAGLRVRGRIDSRGSISRPVTLRGDRLDHLFSYLPYDRVTAQWDGIVIDSCSYGNVIDNTDIHSSCYGIVCAPSDTVEEKLLLRNSVVHNVKGHALSSSNARIRVENTQLSNALGNCLSMQGGRVSVLHATLAQFYPWDGSRACALNVVADASHPVHIELFNSIVTGYGRDELMVQYQKDATIDYRFDHCLLKTVADTLDTCFVACRFEKQSDATYGVKNFPKIDTDVFLYDFTPDSASLAIGLADSARAVLVPLDRRGISRTDNAPDAGCYQFTR